MLEIIEELIEYIKKIGHINALKRNTISLINN